MVYCDTCGNELSRTHVEIPRLSDITLTDDPSTVSITYRSDYYDGEVVLVVIRIVEEDEAAVVNALLPAGFYSSTIYEIHTELDGVEVQPSGSVTVRIPVPEGYPVNEITLYHIDDEGGVTPVEFTVVDNMLVFTTDSFSNYAICVTHSPAEAVVENKTDATCTAPGSYDSVVYCATCGTELAREADIEIPQKDHTPGVTVRENYAAATCTTAERWDDVVYCEICGNELTRDEHVGAIAPNAHGWSEWQTVRAATAAEDGEEKRTCALCGTEETRVVFWDGEPDRMIQFVVYDNMYYTVHLNTGDYNIFRDSTPALMWYSQRPLTFNVGFRTGEWNTNAYMVSVNGVELKPNADGSFTLPAGTDYVKINCSPVTITASGDVRTCAYCGKVHPSNLWGTITRILHTIIYFFQHLFNR